MMSKADKIQLGSSTIKPSFTNTPPSQVDSSRFTEPTITENNYNTISHAGLKSHQSSSAPSSLPPLLPRPKFSSETNLSPMPSQPTTTAKPQIPQIVSTERVPNEFATEIDKLTRDITQSMKQLQSNANQHEKGPLSRPVAASIQGRVSAAQPRESRSYMDEGPSKSHDSLLAAYQDKKHSPEIFESPEIRHTKQYLTNTDRSADLFGPSFGETSTIPLGTNNSSFPEIFDNIPYPFGVNQRNPFSIIDEDMSREGTLTGEFVATPIPNLNLAPEEKRQFGKLFREADKDGIGVVTGEVAVKFFESTKLEPRILGEVCTFRPY
jgi:hypothetical protein